MTQAKEKEKAPSRNQCVNGTLRDDQELGREREEEEREIIPRERAVWKSYCGKQRLKDQNDYSPKDEGEMRPIMNRPEIVSMYREREA